jgi:chaperonin cofactor prefoldin
MRKLLCVLLPLNVLAADLPIREVVLFKHGVGYFSRSGDLPAGETAQLAFKASEMNDVLKSLTISDASGAPIAGVRYDASEPVEQRIAGFPFEVGKGASLAAFLDQMKGARLELGPVAGAIVSGRVVQPEREIVVLLTDAGDIRSFDLSTVPAVRLSDPKLQAMLRDYLGVIGGARSRDRRNVYIDASKQGSRRVTASYMTPSAVWKSSYRLLFGGAGDPTLEGWAIVDNTSGDDWTNVNLAVVSGRPISFISELYEPKYVNRPTAELAENRPVAPQVFRGALGGVADTVRVNDAPAEAKMMMAESVAVSTLAPSTIARDLGELFEYRFATPVTVKQGESAMLPFLQQKLGARKLLIYSESYGLNPMNAAELTNSTGKTLDGGPITVYDANSYAGEALVETLKAGDKRLISYGVDLGTRITTKIDSSAANVRELHLRRGVLTTRNAIQETKTYTINNVDPNRKTLIIEHPLRQGYTLLSEVKPKEVTSTAQRFEVAIGGKAVETFVVREERVYDQTSTITNATPDVLAAMIQGRPLSPAGRTQLDRILAKKREITANQAQTQQTTASLKALDDDQGRYRQNINSLRGVAGQEQLVQQYARQLSTSEAQLTTLRDQQTQLQRSASTLQGELNALIESADF